LFLRQGDVESGPLFSPERYCSYIKSRRKEGQEEISAAETAVCVFVPGKLKVLGELTNARETADHIHRKLRGVWNGNPIDIVYFGIGAPIAASIMEEMACLVTKNFITFGSAGGLQHRDKPESIILPTSAMREQGTVYHYLPPAVTVGTNEQAHRRVVTIVSRHIELVADAGRDLPIDLHA